MKTSEFTDRLIRGQIAETVYEQMIKETGKFTVLPFGYEKLVPEIARINNYTKDNDTLETIRRSPDYAVIYKKTKEVRLVEVKFRSKFNTDEILEIAEKISENWNPAYLFLATPSQFYFGSIENIIAKGGYIPKLSTRTVPKELQDEYIALIQKYEVNATRNILPSSSQNGTR